MSGAGFDRVREVFIAVSGAEPGARSEALDRLCAGDAALRREVESLLAHAPTGDFLEPAIRLAAEPDPGAAARDPMEGMPRTVGPYKLLQVIGEGGFGVVFMAEQEQPVRRRVALKLIRLGMDTKHVLARFEAERQALAMMDHPNIARVLDAGATDAGRPYFVMELVRGVPITEYCDRERLDTRARLGLFVSVCRAVQHAHQKGIIHRDIKPSNVLVTLHDGIPVPKVIDFGIAKATNARLTERTLFTEFRQFIGTPEYMSPEQAEMSGLDVDTRSDIYSLGVLLYELLAGVTPLDGAMLRSRGYAEMQRAIRESDPIRPSLRVSQAKQHTAATARNRGVAPSELRRSLAGDLDWIALRALEKDRSRRYETAAAFAADIERSLRNEPVEARPPSAVYRVRKFIRRNSGAVAVASIIAVGLVVSASGLGVLYTRERAASARALAAEAQERGLRQRAQENLERAIRSDEQARSALERSERVKELLRTALGGDMLTGPALSRETRASELLIGFQAQMEQMRTEDPEVLIEVLRTLSSSYLRLGMYDRARRSMQDALVLGQSRWAPGDPRLAALVIDDAWYGEPRDGRSSRERLEALLPELGEGDEWSSLRAKCLYTLASEYAVASNAARAIELYREAIAENARLAAPLPEFESSAREGLANALFQASRFEESLAESRALVARRPLGESGDFNALRCWTRHSWRLWDLGFPEESLECFRRTAEASDRSLGPQNAESTPRWNTYADCLFAFGLVDEADLVAERALGVLRSEDRPGELMYSLKILSWIALARGEESRAEAWLREAVEVARGAGHGAMNDPDVLWREAQRWMLTATGSLWRDDVLRRAVRTLVAHELEFADPPITSEGGFVRWREVRWWLVRHGDTSVREGTFEELRGLTDLEPGVYALRLRAPRESGPDLDVHGWFLRASWSVSLFPIDGFAPDFPQRFTAGAGAPHTVREDAFLELIWEPGWRPGPGGRSVGFGMVATCESPCLPDGAYDVWVTSDDGERFAVGQDVVTEAWTGRSAATDHGVLTVGPKNRASPWKVEYFQGADACMLKFDVVPKGEAATATLELIGVTGAR